MSTPAKMWDLETPALLLYRDVMERNLTQMADRARKLGVFLRPHIKTHKCLELGRRQLAQGARGITVSTLFEAQAFAGGGFTDLTWAFPLDPTHLPHVRRIADGGAITAPASTPLRGTPSRSRASWGANAASSLTAF
ncbi:MAG: hypothetical protein AUI08_10720 [Gemmatimonadetes bacterium 13_2_20CM_2_65_7]|nr:MAG: hypothetical protein AUI08_10720 [Gemmatimonadetes bacterium 13_2_20CM_2_65_7]